jgi:hypothetical protein
MHTKHQRTAGKAAISKGATNVGRLAWYSVYKASERRNEGRKHRARGSQGMDCHTDPDGAGRQLCPLSVGESVRHYFAGLVPDRDARVVGMEVLG